MDPKAMKNMMAKLGIKTSEIDANRVVIECGDKQIIVTNPQITQIEAQGAVSFQIAGEIEEMEIKVALEATDDDIKLVMEQTGISDKEKIKQAIIDANGDIAEAIVNLKGEN